MQAAANAIPAAESIEARARAHAKSPGKPRRSTVRTRPQYKKPRRLGTGVGDRGDRGRGLSVSSITLPRCASSARGAPVDLPAIAREEQAATVCVGTRPAVAAFDRVDNDGSSPISAASRSQICRVRHYISPQAAERRSSRVARATSPRSCFSAATISRAASSTQRNRSGSPR